MQKPKCFGNPDPRFSSACGSCGVRAECFRRQADMEDVFFLIRPRQPEAEGPKRGSAYVPEKFGAKPWERKKKEEPDAEGA